LLTYLLAQHYGLTLNDTTFSDDAVIHAHIDGGISLADALNAMVENLIWYALTAGAPPVRRNRPS